MTLPVPRWRNHAGRSTKVQGFSCLFKECSQVVRRFAQSSLGHASRHIQPQKSLTSFAKAFYCRGDIAFNEFETLVVVGRSFSGTRKTRMPGKWFESFLLKHLVLVAKHENARNLSKVFLKHAPRQNA